VSSLRAVAWANYQRAYQELELAKRSVALYEEALLAVAEWMPDGGEKEWLADKAKYIHATWRQLDIQQRETTIARRPWEE
jgi:hypothetical protein